MQVSDTACVTGASLPSVKLAVRVTGPLVAPVQVASPFAEASEELSIEMFLGSGFVQAGVASMTHVGTAHPGDAVGETTD